VFVPGEELLDDRPVELCEPGDVRVLVGEPEGEQFQAVATVLDGRRPQGHGGRFEVAGCDPADLVLWDRGDVIGNGAGSAVGVRRWLLDDAELEAHLS
jgi:hypothetical protein